MKSIVLTPAQQKRRLRWVLLLFFITPSLPVYYLLQTVYTQLENQANFNARQQAETLVNQIDSKLKQLLDTEQKRPIAEYQFFNVMENPLLSETAGVKFSPLSEIPPQTNIKGLVGYFQINTDGSFHLPALPELGQDNLSGLSLEELDSRIKLKHQLRQLLSIKNTDKSLQKPAELDESIAEKEQQEIGEQPYIDAFKQQVNKVASAPQTYFEDSMASITPSKKIKARALSKNDWIAKDSAVLGRQLEPSKRKQEYKTRKEVVQLPDQSMASSYFNRSKQRVAQPALEEKLDLQGVKNNVSAINVFSFESEVSPLQMLVIGEDYFCLYRYIWHDNTRYTQGFIVNVPVFLTAISQEIGDSSGFTRLEFLNYSKVILSINMYSSDQGYALYSRHLSTPFQQLQVSVYDSPLAYTPGRTLIDLLGLAIYGIFFIGFVAFYRLGSKQIELAKQQQNFISAVSHELKTPLTSIRMYAEMLRSGWVADESKKSNYYDFIFFESERLSRLISNILQLARVNNNKQKAKIITVSAQSLLTKLSMKLTAQAEAAQFNLQVLQPSDHIGESMIQIDDDAFFQIMINLVDNATKFSVSADKKQIDIGYNLNPKNNSLYFFIRDYGPGIKRNQLKKIFQLFYRSEDELTRSTAGTGIGLALVVQLADTMGAKINVTNKQPGAEFQVHCKISL